MGRGVPAPPPAVHTAAWHPGHRRSGVGVGEGRAGWEPPLGHSGVAGPALSCSKPPSLTGLPVAWHRHRFALPTESHCPLRPRCVSGWSEGWPAAHGGCWLPSRPDTPRVFQHEGCFSTLTRSVRRLHEMKLCGVRVEG